MTFVLIDTTLSPRSSIRTKHFVPEKLGHVANTSALVCACVPLPALMRFNDNNNGRNGRSVELIEIVKSQWDKALPIDINGEGNSRNNEHDARHEERRAVD